MHVLSLEAELLTPWWLSSEKIYSSTEYFKKARKMLPHSFL
jgi:hypothetical protein